MFTIDDAKNAMRTAAIHLASAPGADGGRLRITWHPAPNTFSLTHMLDGAVVYTLNAPRLEQIWDVFAERSRK